MRKIFGLSILGSLFFLLFAIIISAQTPEQIEVEQDFYYSKCAYCHLNDVPPQYNKTKEEWTEIVKRMQSKFPEHISDNDSERIIAYLMTFAGVKSPMINRAKNPGSLTELEKKHIPVIQIADEDMDKKLVTIIVKVGEVEHPMKEDHYIKYIEIFINHRSEGRVELKPGNKPEAKFVVGSFVSKNVIAREECNVHGIWESSVK